MNFRLLVLIMLFCVPLAHTADESWKTYYEKSDYKKTPSYPETIDYCKRLDQASPWVKYTSFGLSPQGRELPLLIVDKSGNFTPEAVLKNGNAVVLIQAGIHSGEIDGKDAGLILIREMVIEKNKSHLLDNITLLFVPIFNVDGHERSSPFNRINQNGPEEMGWRTTSQNLNLNRDFLKADTPEMRAWLRLFNQWLPDFLVDCHVTDGADYQYVVTYGLENSENVVKPLRDFTTGVLEPYLNEKMTADGFPMFPYVMFRDWVNPASGLRSGSSTPRYSTGYGAVQNRIFLLIETHMLKDYKTRVTGTYRLLRHIMEVVYVNAARLRNINQQSDEITKSELPGDFLYLNMDYSARDSVLVDFLGVEYDREFSGISGGERIVYHADKPVTYKLPYFNTVIPTDSVLVPYAYLIPGQWEEQIEILTLHGVEVQRLNKEKRLKVQSYRFKNAAWQERPYEGRHPVTVETIPVTEERTYPAGTAVIVLNQRTNRLIAHLLEPRSPDSFISWGFWDAIFERKEYAESYVLEDLAREMLAADPALKKEFEERVASDSSFASDPRERLYFFYRRSPYWDEQKDVYPVGKLMEPVALPLKPAER